MQKISKSDARKLRQKAIEYLENQSSISATIPAVTDSLPLMHELEVHKIELEMQNEELMLAYERADRASKKYTDLYNLAPFGYLTLSKQAEIMELNIAAEQMLGKNRSNLFMSRFGFFVSDATKPIFNLFIDRVFENKSQETCEVVLETEGNPPIFVNIVAIISQNHELCLLTMEDITPRKKTENSLLERLKELKAFYNISKIVDIEGITLDELYREIVNLLNSSWQYPEITCARIIVDNREFVTKNFLETRWIQSAKIYVNGEVIGKIEVIYLEEMAESDEGPFLAEERLLIDAIADRLGHIIERKRGEAEIQKMNTELTELNASKDKFFSIISHDLRSPFNGFIGLTKIMADETSDFTLKELQEISKKMQISAGNLYTLLENLLEWARIQRNLTEFNPVVCDMYDVIKQNNELEYDTAQQKDIEIVLKISSSYKAKIDKKMIDTVLRNLITNAIKFTPRGGKIEIGKVKKSSDVCIFVKDNGIGMNTDTLEKLFKIDENVTRPGTEKEPSTGLGLLLCKEFVEKHGGKIWAESQEGKGSTFYFSLPK